MPLQFCIYTNTIHTFARENKLNLIRKLATSFRLDNWSNWAKRHCEVQYRKLHKRTRYGNDRL